MNCDCCRVLIGYSEYTIITEHDVQLYICEDCLTIQKRRRNGKRISL